MHSDRTVIIGGAGVGSMIVDDHPVVREGLMQQINREPDLTVCGQASNASEPTVARWIADLKNRRARHAAAGR